MKKRKITLAVEREYLSVRDAAIHMGISERLIRDFLKNPINPVPHFRIGSAGRLIRIKKSDIDSWMENFRSTSDINIDELVNELML